MSKPTALASVPPPGKNGGVGGGLSDARQRAAEGVAGLVEKAVDALRDSLSPAEPGKKRARYGSTRSADARYVLDVILERLPQVEPSGGAGEPARKLTPQEAMTELRKRLESK